MPEVNTKIEEAEVEFVDKPQTNGALIVSEPLQLIPVDEMLKWYNSFSDFTKQILKPGLDFGTIPGVQKPSLFKPGAEKLRFAYGLSTEVKCTSKSEDFVRKFFDYTYLCTVRDKSGRVLAQCEGNCCSEETKYKYIFQPNYSVTPTKDEADQWKAEKRGKQSKINGKWVWCDRIENPEVSTLRNTLMKMAQKRAFVGAMLLATGASEFFTQDVEDMDIQDTKFDIAEFNPRKDAIGFGKHSGTAWANLPDHYVKWLLENSDNETYRAMAKKTIDECFSNGKTSKEDIVGNAGDSQVVKDFEAKITSCEKKADVMKIKKEIDEQITVKEEKVYLMNIINEKMKAL